MTTAAAALTAPTGDFSRTFSPTLTMPLHTISSSCDAADKEPSRERAARLFRKRTTLQVATAASDQNNSHSSQDLSSSHNKTPQKGAGTIQRFDTQEELSKLRAKEKEMMQRWEKDEDGWRELPARAWPAYQPNPEQLKGILAEITILHCDLHAKDDLSNYPNGGVSDDVKLCTDLLFDMATAFVFYNINPKAGLAQYEQLAERGHVDSMVASGIILVEGLGVPPREQEGLAWLEEAVQKGSAQAYYELGTVYYTGIDGVVEEDAEKAFRLFERAAEQDHTAALYMVADCLAEGEGTEKSVARAIPLFYKAAERGHRFSRQRIRELLARLDYPF
jgi:TPR repeat protein